MKNILLAISGLTPQIVTETLFALSVQRKIQIDEIFIITTERGKLVLEGKGKFLNAPETSLKKEISSLCKDYKIPIPFFSLKKNVFVIREETNQLYDVKTDKDNVLFPNKAAEVIARLTAEPEVNLHATLSGGRKSMSAHLALVLSLFARSQDKLYHVLTDERFEQKNFYPKTKEEANALILAEIPFVRLRSLNSPLLKKFKNYYDVVCATQKRLAYLMDNRKLIIELKKRTVRYGQNSINFTPREIALYLLFVENKISDSDPIKIEKIISTDFAQQIKNIMVEEFHQYFDPKLNNKHWTKAGFKAEDFLSLKSKINKKIDSLFEDESLKNEFRILTERIYGESKYFINAPPEKLAVNYE